jgi:hypothetical protein
VQKVRMICEQIQQEEKELLQDIEEFLNMDDYSKQCKKEMLYSKWSQQVFSPLHTSLLSVMESPAIKYTDVQRRNLFDRYITLKNNKVKEQCTEIVISMMIGCIS